jgi:hypothetical protein
MRALLLALFVDMDRRDDHKYTIFAIRRALISLEGEIGNV